jgi:hypothetical protein
MHIYAFGSICRGDIDPRSDIDLLALVEASDQRFDPLQFSVYTYARIRELWTRGNPFAWHLHKESKLLFTATGNDYLADLGAPSGYQNASRDCYMFMDQFERAALSLQNGSNSPVFELSCVYLAMRNFATCYALGFLRVCEFSRRSPRRLGDKSLVLSDSVYEVLERSRLISTRGKGQVVSCEDVKEVVKEMGRIGGWMQQLMENAEHERVQQPA